MVFNLESLNDYEFEILCKDILKRKLNTELYTFSRGRDGGIDICDAAVNPKVVGQVKHYCRSSYSSLLSSLRNEAGRVMQRLKPEKYFVCTSQRLTRENKKEIYELFQECMDDISNIMDASVIDDFLSDEENADIVKKHYKLWFCASNVLSLINNQSVFIDCEDLLDDIEESVKFFVETESYREAMKKLVENRIIIITGNPGVGKSTLSKMLILRFVEEGYSVRYVSDNKVENIKNTLSMSPEKKEIILLDDFLGQHYLKIKESQPNEIKSLVAFIKRNRNKKLILNSRITILNEARQQSIAFREMMEKNEMYTYLIDLDRMSGVVKAEIVYNHMFFNAVPKEYFEQIRRDGRYFRIVYHTNYNPRIIEYVMKPRSYKSVPAGKYFEYIMHKLDAPEDVWRDEFRNRINEEDRILLNTLYSLTNTTIATEKLRESFNNRIREEGLPSALNVYDDTCIRLNGSLLRNVEEQGTVNVGVINPSVNDFLKTNLNSNSVEQIKIARHAVYAEQILKIAVTEEARDVCKKMVLDGTLLDRKVLKNSIHYYYLQQVVGCGLYSADLRENVQKCFQYIYEDISYSERESYGNLIIQLLDKDFVEFYELTPFFKSVKFLDEIIKPLKFRHLKTVLYLIKRRKILTVQEFAEADKVIKDAVCLEVYSEAVDDVDYELDQIVTDIMESCDDRLISAYQEGHEDELENAVYFSLQEKVSERAEEILEEITDLIEVSLEDLEMWSHGYSFDVEGAIDSWLYEEEFYSDDHEEDQDKSESERIKDIFER